jgi:hypothetical protein
MGLDQYAYVAAKAGQNREYWDNYDFDKETSTISKPREIMYWRKHPNLQGWMEKLAERKGVKYDTFNGVELELTWEDLDQLEKDILNNALPSTRGFFFGEESDEYYRAQDLEFIRLAKADLFMGLKVFYNSSW